MVRVGATLSSTPRRMGRRPLAEATRTTAIRYKRLDDLVKFLSMTPAPFLNHAQRAGRHLYFIALPFSGGLLVYYFSSEKRVEGEYVTLNRMSGAVSASGKPSFDAQSLDMPILEVEATDLLDTMK
jgi:hypothetical protein